MTGPGFGVDLAALGLAERGVRDAVAELNDMAGSSEAAVGEEGRGLATYLASGDLSADTVGHAELAAALATFIERWEWGVKYLVEDGVDAADALTDTRSTYEQAEDAAAIAFKRVGHVLAGNPMEDVAAWDDKSAAQLGQELLPDYSAETALASHRKSTQLLEGTTGWDLDGDGRTGGGA